jgi:hypothetical protein
MNLQRHHIEGSIRRSDTFMFQATRPPEGIRNRRIRQWSSLGGPVRINFGDLLVAQGVDAAQQLQPLVLASNAMMLSELRCCPARSFRPIVS